jgi:hypothetical protein
MKTIAVLTLLLATPLACSKSEPAPSTNAAGATSTPSAAADAPKTAAPPAAPPKEAFVQKGIQPGKVVVGYLQVTSDPNACLVVTDAPAKKDQFAKDADKLAQMMKSKVVSSCPTDQVVGTCSVGFGMLANYSGPKWTKDSAKKDCLGTPHASWVE